MATSTASHEGDQGGVVTPRVVARESLFERLSAAERGGGVTLVSAPAGSGKTVLLRSWLDEAGLHDRAAWVSVERNEQDARDRQISPDGAAVRTFVVEAREDLQIAREVRELLERTAAAARQGP